MTDLGRGYHVRCRYKSREAAAATKNSTAKYEKSPEALTSEDDESPNNSVDRREHGRSLGNREIETNEIPMPGCHMKIYSGNSIAENVKIGDPLMLKIYIDKQSLYGMHIVDCMVRDGLGWGEQNLVQFGYVFGTPCTCFRLLN